jgi:hypothetical protein
MKTETMLILFEDLLAQQLAGRETTRKWAQAILTDLSKG